jgi:hypothetical protein
MVMLTAIVNSAYCNYIAVTRYCGLEVEIKWEGRALGLSQPAPQGKKTNQFALV